MGGRGAHVVGEQVGVLAHTIPAKSTVHAVLDRHGLVRQACKRSRANKAMGTPLSQATAPNDLWCTDFKGEFRLGDGRYCYPLTVTD